MLHEKFSKRFNELTDNFSKLSFVSSEYGSDHVPNGQWRQWATIAQNLIRAVYSEASPHYVNFITEYKNCDGFRSQVNTLLAIFLSAKEDFEGGYVFDIELKVSGEIFGDFVLLAKQALFEGHKDVAAVLACAALEDSLKRYASVSKLAVEDKTMQEVINALKSGGLVAGAQKSLLDSMPKIRNLALHAEWSKISEPEVNSVIGFVEQFLLSKF